MAAQFSFLATLALITTLMYHRLRLLKSSSRSAFGAEEFCLKFLRSQFAILFFDLLISDLIQALGFLLNLSHLGKSTLDSSPICTVQGVFIQLGDTSGAFSTVAIAIHTFVVLIIHKPPSTWVLLMALGFKWALVFVLAMIGPIAFATEALGPFYGPAGGWCWISSSYPWERLWLHYVWLFLAGAVSAVTYALIFCNVRRRLRTQYLTKSHDPPAEHTSMENAAKKMLVYPLCYLLLMLPLAIDRLNSIFSQGWSLDVQIGCGVVFTLAGLVDVIVFCWTRNLFWVRSRNGNTSTQSSTESHSKGTIPDNPSSNGRSYSASESNLELQSSNETFISPKKSLQSRINGSAIQFMPAKYSLANIDMNSFDDPDPPGVPQPPSAATHNLWLIYIYSYLSKYTCTLTVRNFAIFFHYTKFREVFHISRTFVRLGSGFWVLTHSRM